MHRCGLTFRFEYSLCHLLYEQRDAVGPLDDVLPNACRQWRVADNAINQSANLALSQPIDREGSHVGPSEPRRLKLRTIRDDQQHAERWYSIHDATEQFEARGVGPMRIFEDHQYRVLT